VKERYIKTTRHESGGLAENRLTENVLKAPICDSTLLESVTDCRRIGGKSGSQTPATGGPGIIETPRSAAGKDPIAGDSAYCRLKFPWAEGDFIVYCVSREDLWKVRKDMRSRGVKPIIYLKAELAVITKATEGQSDGEAAATFQRIHKLKKKSGGWIVGTEGGRKVVQVINKKPPDGIKNLQAEYNKVLARIKKAVVFLQSASDEEKEEWGGAYTEVLGRASAITKELLSKGYGPTSGQLTNGFDV